MGDLSCLSLTVAAAAALLLLTTDDNVAFTTAGLFAFVVHPKLVILAADVFHLDWNVDASGFQSSFFSILSLLFAIFSGNSMGFLYDVRFPTRTVDGMPSALLHEHHPNGIVWI